MSKILKNRYIIEGEPKMGLEGGKRSEMKEKAARNLRL